MFCYRKYTYPITQVKGAPCLRAHAPINGITLHALLVSIYLCIHGVRLCNFETQNSKEYKPLEDGNEVDKDLECSDKNDNIDVIAL